MPLKRTVITKDQQPRSPNQEFQQLLVNSDDRTAVIVGTTFLESQLAVLIRAVSVEEQKFVESELDSRSGASLLGNFSSKIKFLSLLGVLTQDEEHDLNILREIRNDFAHNILGCSFEDADVVKHTRKLRISWAALKTNAAPSRLAFTMSVYALHAMLEHRVKSLAHHGRISNVQIGGA